MKLAFIIRDLGRGGAQRQLTLLAAGLKRQGHEVTILHFYGGAFEPILRAFGVRTVCIHKKSRWDLLGFFGRLVKATREVQPEVLHGYLAESNLMALFLKPFCGSPKIVWGVRDSQTDAHLWGTLGKLSFRLNCLLARFADLIVCNSQAGCDYYAARGYPRGRMQIVPNGIDTVRFQPPRDAQLQGEALAKCEGSKAQRLPPSQADAPPQGAAIAKCQAPQPQLPLPTPLPATPLAKTSRWAHLPAPPPRTFGLVGRLSPMKDHATFLRAAALVPGARFIIIGSGDETYAQQMRDLAQQLGIAERVTWQPAQENMPAVYAGLDCLVNSSAFGEGFSNVIGEAMACGIPCIASDVGDSAWLIGDKERVFPPGDHVALAERMRNLPTHAPGTRQRIVENFSVERLIERTEHLLNKKILWLTTGLGSGGAEMMLAQLVTGMPRLQHVVVSLTGDGKHADVLRKAGIQVHALDMPAGKPTPRALWRLFQLVRQTKADVIMGWMYHGCLAAVLARCMRLKRVPMLWNIRQSLYSLKLEKPGSALVIRLLARLSWLPQRITYNSQLSARQHEAVGYNERKTQLIPNGFDAQKWHPRDSNVERAFRNVERVFQLVPPSPQTPPKTPEPQTAQNVERVFQLVPPSPQTPPKAPEPETAQGVERVFQLVPPSPQTPPKTPEPQTAQNVERVFQLVPPSPPIPPKVDDQESRQRANESLPPFYIGRFGRNAPMKDYPTFIEATKLITERHPHVQFIIVGAGTETLEVPPNVHLLGERHDLPELTAALNIAVSSSAFGEGFPNVVGEAMACAVPVVATDIGDTRWVMGTTGHIVPAGDPHAIAKACIGILEAGITRDDAARERIEKCFSLKSVLAQFEYLLTSSNRSPKSHKTHGANGTRLRPCVALGHQPMTSADGRCVIAPLSTPDQSIPKPPSHPSSSKGAASCSPGLAEPQRGNPGSGSQASQESKPNAFAAHLVHQQRLPAPPPHAAPTEPFRPAPTNSALNRVPLTQGAYSGSPATPIVTTS